MLTPRRIVRNGPSTRPQPPRVQGGLPQPAVTRQQSQLSQTSRRQRSLSDRDSAERRPRGSAVTQSRINGNLNQNDMGFLKKIGKGLKTIGSIATSIIPGPFDDLAFRAVSGLAQPTRRQPSFEPPRLIARNPARNVTQGVPPRAVPTQVFPDIPFVPDLGDLEQFLRGGDPTTSGGAGIFSTANGNGNGAFQQLLGPNTLVMPAQTKVIADAPPGFVVVTAPDGRKFAVRKEFARKTGLWKPRKKPPISVSEAEAIKKADRAKRKVKKLAQKSDFKCVKK